MTKKAATKKISGSIAKKEMEKKIKKALRSPEKAMAGKKEIKHILSKKKKTKPVKAVAETKNKVETKTKAKIKTKAKAKVKVVSATKSKAKDRGRGGKRIEKTEIHKKDKKITKKITRKLEGKAEKIVKKAVVKGKEKILRKVVKKTMPEKKARAGVKAKAKRKPVAAGKIGKVAARKITLTPVGKAKAGIKGEKEAGPGEKTGKTAEAPKKTSTEEVKKIKRPGKAGKGEQVMAAVEAADEKKGYAVKERQCPPIPWETLPSEYGENSITIMVVDPYKIFTFWEVREDTLKTFKGDLAIRVCDVSGVDFERKDADNFFDILLNDRIGSLYLDVSPDREYICEVGIIYDGFFITIARSNKVSTTHVAVAEEAVLSPAPAEAGMRPGY